MSTAPHAHRPTHGPIRPFLPSHDPGRPSRLCANTRLRTSLSALMALLLAANSALAAPRLACDAPIHDFGVIQSTRQPLEHTFTLKNDGDTTLHLAGVKTSCGCTTGEIENKTLAPGARTAIKSSFNPAGRRGPQHKTITVQSDDPATPAYNLELKCDIQPALDIAPPSLFFGSVLFPITTSATARIQSTASNSFRILNIDTSQLKYVVADILTLETGRTYSINVRLTLGAEASPGPIREQITLKTDMPGYESITVPVVAQITAEVRVRPSEIVVSQHSLSRESIQAQLSLLSDNKRNWAITAVEAQGDFAITSGPLQTDHITLAIRGLSPPASFPEKRIRLTARAADGAERTVIIPFRYYAPKANNRQ